MARSRNKTRKTIRPGTSSHRAQLDLPENAAASWIRKLNGSRIIHLRNDPDFLTLVKFGRAMNTVLFAFTCVKDYGNTPGARFERQYKRACFILGGYLHESIQLVVAVKGRYLTEPAFDKLRVLALDSKHKRSRFYVKKIRNHIAFHLDENDAVTRDTLQSLPLTTMPFARGYGKSFEDYYFEFADLVDIAFLEKALDGEASENEPDAFILDSVVRFGFQFIEAAAEFQLALSERIKIKDHIY
jgi:hypothetical protein